MGSNASAFVAGLAYEYEFSGKQKAATNGLAIAEPSLKGSSVIGTLGFNYKKAPDSKFSAGLNLNGYVGKRQGIGVNVEFKWVF